MLKTPLRSMLHLQMGQEVLYLLMTIGIMASLVLLVYARVLQNARDEAAAQLAALQVEYAALPPQDRPQPDDQPPIITLSEAKGYYFPSGSAKLSDEFRHALAQQIVSRILEISRRYEAEMVEVVGHTDEVPVRSAQSTIDQSLLPFLNWQGSAEPVASDNAGLGMARAAAVVRELRSDPRLKTLIILPLSAGQTTTVDHQLSTGGLAQLSDQQRRRIEIRVRRRFRRLTGVTRHRRDDAVRRNT